MARNLNSPCKGCRREGIKLFLKGTRCVSAKCPLEKRVSSPRKRGKRRTKVSNYGIQLREKQRVKRIYGIMEKQFRRYFREAEKSKGITGEILLQILERRLDNIICSSSLAASRPQARQLVKHGHIMVNDRKVDLPSYPVNQNDVIKIKDKAHIVKKVKETIKDLQEKETPSWLDIDNTKLEIRVKRLPQRSDIQFAIREQLIVELYSK